MLNASTNTLSVIFTPADTLDYSSVTDSVTLVVAPAPLTVAAANAGVLGLLSTSGLFSKDTQPWVYNAFVDSGEANRDDDMATVLEKVLKMR